MQRLRRSLFLITLPLVTLGCLSSSIDTAKGQIIPDKTLGAERSVVNTNANIDRINGGARRGANLFHSFQEFSVREGRAALFSNPAGIENIFSRVTGEKPSNILGTLGVADGNANLFFMNPNGVFFGPNARLDLRGSFLASTANSLLFDGGLEFSASNPQAPPMLTVNIPIGLKFRDKPGRITNRSVADNVGLQVDSGKTLSLVGGDISLNRGRLTAQGGQVNLGGLAEAGTVGVKSDGSLSFPDGVARGNVSLTNGAQVDVTAGGGGSVNIYAQNLDILGNSPICAGIGATITCGKRTSDIGSVESKAGNVTLNVLGALTIQDSRVENDVNPGAIGQGGNLNILARSLSLSNDAQLSSSTYGQGDAGNINIIKAGSLSVSDDAKIDASTEGKGDAGNINLQVDGSVLLTGNDTYIVSNVGNSAEGKGGNITITADSLIVKEGAQVNAFTRGQGNAGNVTIQANGAVSFDALGSSEEYPSGVASNVEEGAVGNGGNININAGSLSLTNGGKLSVIVRDASQTLPGGQGIGGNVNIKVRDAAVISGKSGIYSRLGVGAVGKGGNINIIKAGSLSVSDDAQINASTEGKGDAGNINLQADGSVLFTGNDTYIVSNVGNSAEGKGGNITITADSLIVKEGAQVNAFTRGQGNAGNVTIQANGAVSFDALGSSEEYPSGVASNVEEGAVGNGGNININAGSLSLTNGGKLSVIVRDASQTLPGGQGIGGNVNIKVRDAAVISGKSGIYSRLGVGAVGKGGNINIIKAGSLSVSDDAQINASTEGKGDAGNINLQADGSVLFTGNDTYIVSNVGNSAEGKGGNITITADSLIVKEGAQVNAFTRGQGNAGNVTIQANGAVSFDALGSSEEYPSGVASNVEEGAVGNGGNININAGSLSLTNGGKLSVIVRDASQTLPGGQGIGGNVNIKVRDAAVISGKSGIYSRLGVGAVGKGGNINIIKAGSLSVSDDAQINASTEGKGDAGNINLQADGSVLFTGNDTYIVSNVRKLAEGKGGNINITADSLTVKDGAQVNAFTRGRGDAGNVTIQATGAVSFDGRSSNNEYASGVVNSVEETGIGNGGNIHINAEELSLTNGGLLSVSNLGKGIAGNITAITKKDIRLDNQASIEANTVGGKGNITLKSRDLILRRNSNITTNATGPATGGNITINTDNLVALENSDITANAEESFGGRVKITAQGIFGIKFRKQVTLESDITASSELGPQFSGEVKLNLPNVDPSHGLVELPKNVVDPTEQIAQNPCQRGLNSKFIITGRGGLPPSPNEVTSSDAVQVDLVEPAPGGSRGAEAQRRSTSLRDATRTATLSGQGAEEKGKSSVAKPIVPAQGWILDKNGEVMLTAYDPTGTGSQRPLNSDACPAP